MSKLDLGPVGVALNVSDGEAYLRQAAELERLGYATIWLPGGQIDTLDRIVAIIRATTSVPVASAVIPLDVYGPAAVTQLYAQLQASAPGRFVVGLGGPQQSRPLAALNDYLDRLDLAEPPVPADGSWPRSARASLSSPATGPPGRSRCWSRPPIPPRRGGSWAAGPPSSLTRWWCSAPARPGPASSPAGRSGSCPASAGTAPISPGWASPAPTSTVSATGSWTSW